MKANDGSGNIPERDEWRTPKLIWAKLEKQYNFSFDCCSNYNDFNIPYSSDFLNEKCLDGYVCWMNPPFSKAKDMFKHFFDIVVKGVAIYRCDNLETQIWQNIIFPNCSWIFIPKGRVSYHLLTDIADGRNGSRFPSALIGLNVDMPKYINGICLKKG